ncbi:hypothetical protein D7Y41_30755, partial [Anaerotruncus sp. 1XD22-93]
CYPPPKNYKISSAFSYNFKLALTQIEGQPVEVLHPGDVALCPPGVKHWHGGSAGTTFAHIAINTNPEKTGLEWFDRISDEEYAELPTE